MKRYHWQGYEVQVDEAVTRAWYQTAAMWDCDCDGCRNFLTLARKRKLPPALLMMLDELGIPPEKATNVCDYDSQGEKRVYVVAYRLAGWLLTDFEHGPVQMEWGLVFCGEEINPTVAKDFPKPYFDLTLDLWLPWVLDAPLEAEQERGAGRG